MTQLPQNLLGAFPFLEVDQWNGSLLTAARTAENLLQPEMILTRMGNSSPSDINYLNKCLQQPTCVVTTSRNVANRFSLVEGKLMILHGALYSRHKAASERRYLRPLAEVLTGNMWLSIPVYGLLLRETQIVLKEARELKTIVAVQAEHGKLPELLDCVNKVSKHCEICDRPLETTQKT
ncbi:hypothetical protein K470DRAFT_261257 [Piedraia hortae CBS 480.64]|uniref:Uncharacterized protein n=1 Tax=Piedraia hortae CBS 480.64 TaxID=1314780 RepID=A0A6A7CAC3_9PEZI|nr:hypothetical protein K470DRAFT_261257 [Piedraia hortae CBS 480.64]